MPNIIVNNYIKYQYICFLHHFLNKLYLRLTLRKIKNPTKLRNIKQKIQTFTFHPLSVILHIADCKSKQCNIPKLGKILLQYMCALHTFNSSISQIAKQFICLVCLSYYCILKHYRCQ